LASREASADRLGTFEGHMAWLRELVAAIDGEAPDIAPAAAPDRGGM